jgi:hypothetical protein
MPDPRQGGEPKPRVIKRKPDRGTKISLLENVVKRGSVGEPSSSYDVNECEDANGPSETREMPPLRAVPTCCQEETIWDEQKNEKDKPNKKECDRVHGV